MAASEIRAAKITLTTVLPGVRDGDKNVDWREVAERLLEQVNNLTRQLDEAQGPWRAQMTEFERNLQRHVHGSFVIGDLELDADGDLTLYPSPMSVPVRK